MEKKVVTHKYPFTKEEQKQIDDWLEENSDLMESLAELEEREKNESERADRASTERKS